MPSIPLHFVPGRTLKRFQRSSMQVRGVMGPIGSGKTACLLIEQLRKATEQRPSPIDGVRYSRWVAIRDTYRNLERTTIPSWHEWVPKEAGAWKGGSSGEPATHTIKLNLKDGTKVHVEIMFVAIGDAAVEDVFRGFPVTGMYVNEADRLSIDVLHVGKQRLGRYPPKMHGGASWRGMWCDFNAPNWGDPICDYFIENPAEDVDFFEQPSGFSPDAENIENLPPGYYENAAIGQPEYWVRRMIENKIGYSRDGMPVYPEFNHKLHVADRIIEPIDHRSLIVGLDAGRTPAAGFQQRDSEGQLRLIAELVCDGIGAQAFGRLLSEFIAERFPGLHVLGYADPAAAVPDQSSNADDEAWMDIVSNEAEIRIREAPSQNPTDRRQALQQPLTRMITRDKPGLIISPDMKMTIRGLAFGFHYRQRRQASGLYHDKPDKNEFSHIIEAHEYAALASGDFAALRGRRRHRMKGRRKTVTQWRAGGF